MGGHRIAIASPGSHRARGTKQLRSGKRVSKWVGRYHALRLARFADPRCPATQTLTYFTSLYLTYLSSVISESTYYYTTTTTTTTDYY